MNQPSPSSKKAKNASSRIINGKPTVPVITPPPPPPPPPQPIISYYLQQFPTTIMHQEIRLLCIVIALINVITGFVLYSKEHKDGITVSSGTRRKAIITCTMMSIIASGIAFSLMMIELLESS